MAALALLLESRPVRSAQAAHESVETVIPELAERWSWQDTYRNLVFFLRKNVRWHDGQPFSAKDVKYTQWPYVKNLVPHNALYNYGRMQDVWLDK